MSGTFAIKRVSMMVADTTWYFIIHVITTIDSLSKSLIGDKYYMTLNMIKIVNCIRHWFESTSSSEIYNKYDTNTVQINASQLILSQW